MSIRPIEQLASDRWLGAEGIEGKRLAPAGSGTDIDFGQGTPPGEFWRGITSDLFGTVETEPEVCSSDASSSPSRGWLFPA